jgi:hypothetical protein
MLVVQRPLTELGESIMYSKGMVQVTGVTYRIVRLRPYVYEVVRLLDDEKLGTFGSGPPFWLSPKGVSLALLSEIALAAVRNSKVSWVGTLLAPA